MFILSQIGATTSGNYSTLDAINSENGGSAGGGTGCFGFIAGQMIIQAYLTWACDIAIRLD
ncbi:MAG: hypothetical protein O7D86_09660 [Proteobacteria bacterium]|nr:hypothetical protein [Pseudomonadota bacterium]